MIAVAAIEVRATTARSRSWFVVADADPDRAIAAVRDRCADRGVTIELTGAAFLSVPHAAPYVELVHARDF